MKRKLVERLGKFGREIHLLIVGPSGREPVACDHTVAHGHHLRIGGLVPASAVLQIYDYRGRVGSRECVAVESDAVCGGHFGENAVACQRHGIIAGLGHFL